MLLKLCQSTAPVQKWAEGRRSDQVFQAYRREYKCCFAWIKAGKITEQQFADWHKAAKAKKKDCVAISLDELKKWLRDHYKEPQSRKGISLDDFREWLKDS